VESKHFEAFKRLPIPPYRSPRRRLFALRHDVSFTPDQAFFHLIHLDREGQMMGNSSYGGNVMVATKDNTVWLVKFDFPREQAIWLWVS